MRALYERVQRLVYWIPKVWNSYDFDSYYLLKVEVEKLRRLEKVIRNGHTMDCIKDADEIFRCIELGEKILGNFDRGSQEDIDEFYSTIAKNLLNWWD